MTERDYEGLCIVLLEPEAPDHARASAGSKLLARALYNLERIADAAEHASHPRPQSLFEGGQSK